MKKNWINLQNIGFLSLLLIFYVIIIATTRLILGGTTWGGDFIIALILSIVSCFLFLSEVRDKRAILLASGIFIVVLILCISVCSFIYGWSFDDNSYHKMAVGLLKNGWNPLQESSETFGIAYFGEEKVPMSSLWIDHYGKASWTFASVLYALVGNIECGKVYNILAMLALFCLAVPYLVNKGFKKRKAIIIGALLSLNPVSLCQVFSYYVDGFLFSYLFILILGLTQLIDVQNQSLKRQAWVIIFCSMLVLSNIKFTGLLYGGIYCIAYFLLYAYYQWYNNRKLWIRKTVRVGGMFFFLAVLSITWIGFPTYVKNFLDHGTWTYPLTGSDVDIMTSNSPSGFAGENSIFKFFYSCFGEMENLTYTSDLSLPILKIPFTVSKSEIMTVIGPDMRISGFGLFFSGIFIISLLVYVWYLFFGKSSKCKRVYFVVNLVLIVLLIVGISESWWARYAPYVYLIPVLASTILMEVEWHGWKKVGYKIFVIVFLINNLHFALWPTINMYRSIDVLQNLNRLTGSTINIALNGSFPGKLFDFEDKGITYHIVDEIEKPDGVCYDESWEWDKE